MIRLSLAEIETWQKDVVVHTNTGCIYKFQHEDRTSKELKTQIAVGVVKAQRQCPDSGEILYDIRFCPPKGARPASGKRHDTLYQDICAGYAYNLHYRSKCGKKVEEEDNNLPRSVMLAFNLVLNNDGTFCKRRRNDTPNNMSSYELAENVISLFYGSP